MPRPRRADQVDSANSISRPPRRSNTIDSDRDPDREDADARWRDRPTAPSSPPRCRPCSASQPHHSAGALSTIAPSITMPWAMAPPGAGALRLLERALARPRHGVRRHHRRDAREPEPAQEQRRAHARPSRAGAPTGRSSEIATGIATASSGMPISSTGTSRPMRSDHAAHAAGDVHPHRRGVVGDIVVRQPAEEQRRERHRHERDDLERHAGDQQRHGRDRRGDRDHEDVHDVATVAEPVHEAPRRDRRRPACPGATPNQPSPPRSRPEHGRSVVVSSRRTEPRPEQRQHDERADGDEQASRRRRRRPARHGPGTPRPRRAA